MIENAAKDCPGRCAHESCKEMLETIRWRSENRKWGRQLILMLNNIYEENGSAPSWDDFKDLWESVQE